MSTLNDITAQQPATPNYMTIKQVTAKYPAINESTIRWAIFNRERNGFAKVCRKPGRRILIDETLFLEWINGCTL